MPYKDPQTARNYHREYKQLRRAGDCQTPCQTRLPAEFRLQTARDVITLLAEQVDAVRNEKDASTLEKARCIGYLGAIALKAIDAGDIAARVEAVESVLKKRQQSRNGHR